MKGDEYQNRDGVKLDGSDLAALSQLQPWRSLIRIGLEWAMIVAAMIVCDRYWNLPLYVGTIIWIGARQHALAVLMHEGAHVRLVSSRAWNDWLAEILTAWPIFITMKAYRRSHFAHHQFVNTERDPDWVMKVKYNEEDWQFPKNRWHLVRLLLRDLLGLNSLMMLKLLVFYSINPIAPRGRERRRDLRYVFLRVGCYSAVLGVLAATGLLVEFVLYWVIPFFTWLAMLLHIRSIAEHFGVQNEHQLNRTRTTYPSWWEKVLLAPCNTNYHLDHHLYPSIPYYNLPAAHRLLLQQEAFADQAHLTRTYLGVLRECTR